MKNPLDKKIILDANPWLNDVKILDESISTQLDAKADGQANTLYMSEKQTGIYGRFGREYYASPERRYLYDTPLKACRIFGNSA